jgi:hypothetical protein
MLDGPWDVLLDGAAIHPSRAHDRYHSHRCQKEHQQEDSGFLWFHGCLPLFVFFEISGGTA